MQDKNDEFSVTSHSSSPVASSAPTASCSQPEAHSGRTSQPRIELPLMVRSWLENCPDVSPDVFGILLRWMYTDVMDTKINDDDLLDLARAAVRYQLKALRDR